MRQRFNPFLLALVLTLAFCLGCSKQKAPETKAAEEPKQEEAPVPAGPEAPPAQPEPVPAPAEETPAPAPPPPPVEKQEEKSSSIWDSLRPTPAPPVVPKEEPLKVYYQKDPIPESWCAAWTEANHLPVTQIQVTAVDSFPKDGDLYLFTPDRLAQVVSGPGAHPLDPKWARAGLDPVFTGHPFDSENISTRPWRWTPYLLYAQASRTAPWKGKRLLDLWADAKALWPNQPALLAGLSLKDEKSSANPRDPQRWKSACQAMQNRLHDKQAPESDCWSKIQTGEIELTLLPASCRLSLPPESTAGLDWALPPGGTLIYFEQLAVGEQSKQKEKALALAEYLLQVAQQRRLLAETGYFSVRTKPGSESQQTALNLATKDWFDQSEFLMAEPPPEPAAATPAVEPPAAAAPVPAEQPVTETKTETAPAVP